MLVDAGKRRSAKRDDAVADYLSMMPLCRRTGSDIKVKGADNRRPGKPPHFAACDVDLAVEIVTQFIDLCEQFGSLDFLARLGGSNQHGEYQLVTTTLFLQNFDPVVKPRQRDVVTEVERVLDLPIYVESGSGDILVAGFAGARDHLPQSIEFMFIISAKPAVIAR